MATLNNVPIEKILDEAKSIEIREDRHQSIKKIRRSLYKPYKEEHRGFRDKDQKSGEVKHYSKEEIKEYEANNSFWLS